MQNRLILKNRLDHFFARFYEIIHTMCLNCEDAWNKWLMSHLHKIETNESLHSFVDLGENLLDGLAAGCLNGLMF